MNSGYQCVALLLPVDILWHFLCGGLSACRIRALAGFGGHSCCGLRLLPWMHVGGLCVLCGLPGGWYLRRICTV